MSVKVSLKLLFKDFNSLLHDFSFKSKSSKRAFKAAIAVMCSLFVSHLIGLEFPFWSGITAVIMMQPHVGSTLEKAKYRFAGTVGGAILGLVVSYIFHFDVYALFAAVILILFFIYYQRFKRGNHYAWFLFGMTFFIVSSVGLMEGTVHSIVWVAITRTAQVCVGISVSLMVSLFVFPDFAYEELNIKFEQIQLDYLNFLKKILLGYQNIEKSDYKSVEKLFDLILSDLASIKNGMKHLKYELKIYRNIHRITILDLDRFDTCIRQTWDFYKMQYKNSDASYQQYFKKYLTEVTESLESVIPIPLDLKESTKKLYFKTISDASKEFNKYISRHHALIRKEMHKQHTSKDTMLFHECIHTIRSFIILIKSMVTEDETIKEKYSGVKLEKISPNMLFLNFKLFRFKISIPSLQYAVKGCLAVTLLCLTWILLDMPGGPVDLAIAVMVVFMPDLIDTYSKGLQRFVGCSVGAIIGISLYLTPIHDPFIISLISFAVLYFLLYVNTGKANVAYSGLQAALAFIVAIFHGSHLATDIHPVLERFYGIFLGVGIAWIVSRYIWPFNVKKTLKSQVQSIEAKLITASDKIKNISHRQRCFDFTMIDFSPIENSINVLTKQQKLSQEELDAYKDWLYHIKRLYSCFEVIFNRKQETFVSIKTQHLIMFDLISRMLHQYSTHSLKYSEENIKLKTELLLFHVDYILEDVRKGIIRDRAATYKQDYALVIFTLRRLVRSLEKLLLFQLTH